jgi:pyruvate/2-oxoglutarate dehydrogenase complex dihydrolipoamide dehydrogenase (E3) component
VKIIKNIKIQNSKTTAEGKIELTLSNGETKIVDLYLHTVGVLPNSEFIPQELLSEKGHVRVDGFLKISEAGDVWAAGNIVDTELSQVVYAEKQATWLAKNLDLVLKGKKPLASKYGGDRKSPSSV